MGGGGFLGDAGSQMGLGWESVQLPNWSNNRVGLTSRWWSWNPGREYQEEGKTFTFNMLQCYTLTFTA